MTKKNYRKKRRKNRLGYFFFGMIVFYLLIKFIPMLISSSNETSIAQYGNIQVVHHLNCYVIRNEQLIISNAEGDIKYFVQEGEKVEKGYKVVEIHKDAVDEITRKKLEVINQRIESLNDNKEYLFQSDVEKLDKEINNIIDNLKQYKEKGDLLKIYQLKKDLESKLDKKRIIVGDKSFAGKNLEALKVEQKQLVNQINNSIIAISSPVSGIISYKIDGYETILNPQNMATIELNKLKNMERSVTDLRGTKVINQQPLFKVVDNNSWYMITWIEKEYLEDYKEGRSVTFNFPQGQIQGKILQIVLDDPKSMVIFEMDEYIEGFDTLRNISLDVVAVNYEGIKIYRDSIVERDGKKGVYVLDINRHASFKPIKIIGYDDTYAIIKSNIFYEKDGEDMKTITTVKLYDEIVRKASKIDQGQVIY
ncbi:HlyD family efflux transporter periplasmic adaptor subunit [Clostridiaceae bacterium 35-E11]